MKKKLFISLLAIPFVLSGCFLINRNSNNSGKNSSIDEDEQITVTFYLDLNQKIAKNVYNKQVLTWNDKITKPTDPTEGLDPANPVFKGWSMKEIIDDDADLFDFNTKLTEDIVDSFMTVDLFGIWVAEGE